MADRYQDKSSPADHYDRGTQRAPGRDESDPLAELARLIGQTDPLSNFGRANQPMPAREPASWQQPEPAPEVQEAPAMSPPRWVQSAARAETEQHENFTHSVQPLGRYAAQPAAEPEYHEAPPFTAEAEQHHHADPARYDDALYG